MIASALCWKQAKGGYKGDIPKKVQKQLEHELKLRRELDYDSLMFDWMGDFQQLERLQNTMDYPEVMQYLQKEEERVGIVKSSIINSIAGSRQFLSELQSN